MNRFLSSKFTGKFARDEEDNLTYSDEIVKVKHPELIFGTSYKMQYIDPYLFFTTEFRKFTLEAQLIITIGYGFGDEHINGMLRQAIRGDKNKKILCAQFNADEKHIYNEINPKERNQVVINNIKSKAFIEEKLKIEELEKLLPDEESIFQN